MKNSAVLPLLSKVYQRAYNNQAYAVSLNLTRPLCPTSCICDLDTLEPAEQDGVVYMIHWECRKACIEETRRAMRERMKEHNRDIWLARTQTSAISETDKTGHLSIWDKVKFHSKWFEPLSIRSSYCVIVQVRVVLKRTVAGD